MLSKITNALLVFKQYCFYSGKPKSINPIHQWRLHCEGACASEMRTQHKKLFRYVCEMIGKSDSTGCEFSDYMELYHIIRDLKPKWVLECGCGITSCVIAFALKQNEEEYGVRGKLVSMEEYEFYYNQVVEIFPHDLSDYVDFVRSDRVETQFGSFHSKGCHYADVPNHPYDFVFIDGPTLKKNKQSPHCFNADFINVLLNADADKQVEGIIDHRLLTIAAFKKLIPGAKMKHRIKKTLTRIYGARKEDLSKELLS